MNEILEKSKLGVVNIVKDYNEEGVYAYFQVTSNPTILKSMGFANGLLEVNHKVLLDPEKLEGFNLLTENIDLNAPLVKETSNLVLNLYYRKTG